MKNKEIKKILERIKDNFEEIEIEFNKLPNEIQINILDYHSSFSLNSMVRWGVQNTEELIFGIKEISIEK